MNNEIEEIKKNYYIAKCGRIFLKKSPYLSIDSISKIPITTGSFNRFCKRLNLQPQQFNQKFTGIYNTSHKRLYVYECLDKTIFKWRELKQNAVDTNGYYVVSVNGKTRKVHRLVMLTHHYIENHEEMQVNHIDGNKNHNNDNNLEWCTAKENIQHAWKHKLSKRTKQQDKKLSQSLLKKNDISYIFTIECRKTKRALIGFLKRRGIDINLYEFIKLDKDKTNHGLGYMKLIK